MKPTSLTLLGFSVRIAMFICLGSVVVAESTRFEKDVLPILYHHCFACHSEKQAEPKGNLLLDAAEAIRESGVIVEGKPDESELMKRVSLPHTDQEAMPPLKGGAQSLSDPERATLRQWIADGARTDECTSSLHQAS